MTQIVDNIDGSTSLNDVGSPIPVPFGTAGICLPPYLGSSGTALAGQNMIVGFGTTCVVERVWTDTDPNTPGLELMVTWSDGPGTPTYVSGTAFSVTSGNDQFYEAGMPVRRIYSGGTAYSDIASITGGTVVAVTHSIFGTPIGTVQIAPEFVVERDRFQYVGTGGTTALTTLRMFTSTNSPVVSRISDTAYLNPATAIKAILTNPDWGIGGSADSTSFTQAATDFATAGLGSAVSGVLGGAHEQRRALDVINELASFRGMRIWKDADSAAWMGTVDNAPAASATTLSFGGDYGGTPSPNNVKAIRSLSTTPLSSATSVLKLQYGKSWRDRGDRSIEEVNYFYANTTTALAIGAERTTQNPWLSDHLPAARVAYYQAKRIAREDRQVVVDMGKEARRLALGDVVTLDLQVTPSTRLTGDYRIIQVERTLSTFTLTLAGPYNADIYATDASTINANVNQPSGDINPDERGTNPGTDANLILNADWTAGLTKAAPSDVLLVDSEIIPDWNIIYPAGLASVRVVRTPQAKGGAYLELERIPAPFDSTFLAVADEETEHPYDGAINITGGTNYLLSVYADTTANWRYDIEWHDTADAQITADPKAVNPTIRVNPGDVNGLGWQRYYSIITAPPSAGFVIPRLELNGTTATTNRFDAVQFEEVTRISLRPSPWKRNTRYGIRPDRLTQGTVNVRATGKTENATALSVLHNDAVGLSGGTVALGTVTPGLVTGFTGRVSSGITGVTSWTLAFDYGGGTVTTVMSGLGTAVGTFVTDASNAAGDLTFPLHMTTAVPFVAIAVGGTAFTGGSVSASCHQITHTPVEA